MFQIHDMTEAHLSTVTNRVEKHGDDDRPAVSLGLEIMAPNTLLDQIDPALRHALYKAVDDQEALPGVEPATPVLRCNSFDTHALTTVHEGWTLAVDDGIDDTRPMMFGGVKIDKFKLEAKQGGIIVLRFRAGTCDIDADKLGKLAMRNGQSIWITLTAPEKNAAAIDGTQAAFDADHPDAGDLFAAAHGGDQQSGDPASGEDEDSDGGATDLDERLDNATARADSVPSGKRTERGRRKMREALASGSL